MAIEEIINEVHALVAAAVKAENDRIVGLLDDWRCGHPDCDGDKTEVCYPKHYLIERIKGSME